MSGMTDRRPERTLKTAKIDTREDPSLDLVQPGVNVALWCKELSMAPVSGDSAGVGPFYI